MVIKLCTDFDSINLNLLFNLFDKKEYDYCFQNEEIYLFLPVNNLSSIRNIMKEVKVDNYFVKEINKKDLEYLKDTFIGSWCSEKLFNEEKKQLEKEKQAELYNMLQNIENARLLLREKVNKGGDKVVK